jgi:hypothetical protein
MRGREERMIRVSVQVRSGAASSANWTILRTAKRVFSLAVRSFHLLLVAVMIIYFSFWLSPAVA